jgi:hypothetical protein
MFAMPWSLNVSITHPVVPFQTACDVAGMNESKNIERLGPVMMLSSYSTPVVS